MNTENERIIHPLVKMLAGHAPDTPDEFIIGCSDEILETEAEKPCGVLTWCPYRPLIEQFPLALEIGDEYLPLNDHSARLLFGPYCHDYFFGETLTAEEATAVCDECTANRKAAEELIVPQNGAPDS